MPRGQFARDTEKTEAETRADIEQVLTKYGASGYGCLHEGDHWRIIFHINERMVQVDFTTPQREDFVHDSAGRNRPITRVQGAWEQGRRSFWRAIYNVIKFKLEAVVIGFSTLEREFLADVLLPDGSKVGEWLQPQLDRVYKSGTMPPMLPEARKAE